MNKRVIQVVGAAIVQDDKCLVAQRSTAMSLPLKWEFPGGKIRVGETPEQALEREIFEELGVIAEVGKVLGSGYSVVGEKEILLTVFTARLLKGDPYPHEHSAIRWIAASEVSDLDWAEADVPVLPALEAYLSDSRWEYRH